jgi:hypothetical protein
MPSAAKQILFILLIPFLLAASHDIYLNYFSTSEKIREIKSLRVNTDEFMVSDLGWVWQAYGPSTMEMARDMTEESAWKVNVDPILQQPTLYVAVLPFLGGAVGLLVTFILGVWPFSRFGTQRKKDKAGYGVYKNAKGAKVNYKKK